MKVVIAPDSYKNCLSAARVAEAIARGWRAARPDDELVLLPLADGGEGTTEALTGALGGVLRRCRVHDALGRPVEALYGIAGKCAVVEMAQASGIERLAPEEYDALRATTYGFGELLKQAAATGADSVIAGIGGSATTDGGAGCAQALGWRIFDRDGRELPPGIGGGDLGRIARLEAPDVPLPCRLSVACDVTAPLTGPDGAARCFAPQKGASPDQVECLDANLAHWAGLWRDAGTEPGDGAAGGLGFFLRRGLDAVIRPGAEAVFEAVGLPRHLRGAGLVITGEGRSDRQTGAGKLPSRLAALAGQYGVPVLLLSGALEGDLPGFLACFSVARGPGGLAEALRNAAVNLEAASFNLARLCGRF